MTRALCIELLKMVHLFLNTWHFIIGSLLTYKNGFNSGQYDKSKSRTPYGRVLDNRDWGDDGSAMSTFNIAIRSLDTERPSVFLWLHSIHSHAYISNRLPGRPACV